MPVKVRDTGSLITRYLHFLLRATFQGKKHLSNIQHSLKHGLLGLVGYAVGPEGVPGCTGQGSQGSDSLALWPLE